MGHEVINMIPDTDFIIFFDESGKQKSDKVQLVIEKMVYSKLPERIVYGLEKYPCLSLTAK